MSQRLKKRAPGRRRKSRGYTLVEVVFSILLSAVIVTSVMTVATSVRSGDAKADRKMLAGGAARQLDGMLKNFKRSESYIGASMPIDGPNRWRGGAAKWSLDGMPGHGGAIDDLAGVDVDALAPGPHRLTNFLPDWFETRYGAYAEYTVRGSVGQVQEITINIVWVEP